MFLIGVGAATVLAGCSDDARSDDARFADTRPILDLTTVDDVAAGDVIALRDDGTGGVEWIERQTGRIVRLADIARFADQPASSDDLEHVATVDVTGPNGEAPGDQRGLLGQTVIDGVRYVAWTSPDDMHLRVGALASAENGDVATIDRIVWDAGGTSGGAVGGQLTHIAATAALDDGGDGSDRLVLGIGQLTEWAKRNGGGAMVLLDPNGPPGQTPTVLSAGYVNPFAFTIGDGVGTGPIVTTPLWVADNAVGDDTERLGRADLADRDEHPSTGAPPRAPSAMIDLGDDRFGICGFLDQELQAWSLDDTLTPRQGDTLGPCLTGATNVALDDGDPVIVTATADALIALTP